MVPLLDYSRHMIETNERRISPRSRGLARPRRAMINGGGCGSEEVVVVAHVSGCEETAELSRYRRVWAVDEGEGGRCRVSVRMVNMTREVLYADGQRCEMVDQRPEW